MARAFAAAFAALLVAAIPGAAAAAPGEATGLRNARYCEILELRGAPPAATVVVWNTIGFNDCPAAWWEALDAQEIARERGASAVILNGPRRWLIDAASGRVGGSRVLAGERLRQVATIPIRTSAELARLPYTERTVARRNTWRWKPGRLVFELLAPGGRRYVMQSLAQITDPGLTLPQLPRLGRRLDLPDGWRYRARRLRRELVLTAAGRATIVQDELQNTYQLASPATRR